MSNGKIFIVSVHNNDGSSSELLEGEWDQAFSEYERAAAVYELLNEAFEDTPFFVTLQTVTVTGENEPYVMQEYNEETRVFNDKFYATAEELTEQIVEVLFNG